MEGNKAAVVVVSTVLGLMVIRWRGRRGLGGVVLLVGHPVGPWHCSAFTKLFIDVSSAMWRPSGVALGGRGCQ